MNTIHQSYSVPASGTTITNQSSAVHNSNRLPNPYSFTQYVSHPSHNHRTSVDSAGTPEFDYRTDSSLSPASYDLATPPYAPAGESTSSIYELPPLHNKRHSYLDYNPPAQFGNILQAQPQLSMTSALLPIQRPSFPQPNYDQSTETLPPPPRHHLLNYQSTPAVEQRQYNYAPAPLPFPISSSFQLPPTLPALPYHSAYNPPYYANAEYANYPTFNSQEISQVGPSRGRVSNVTVQPATRSEAAPRKKAALNANGKPIRKVSTQTFACPHPHCESVFSRNFNMQSHLKAHQGIRDFDCFHCIKKFSRRHDRARHIAAVHGISLEAQAASTAT